MTFKSMLLAAAALVLTATPALAAPPMAVKKHASERTLNRRPAFNPNRSYSHMLKLPAPRYISMAAPAAGNALPDIVGGMIHSDSWTTTNNFGLYKLPKSAGEPFEFVCSGIFPNGGGVEAEGVYYSCEVEEGSEG